MASPIRLPIRGADTAGDAVGRPSVRTTAARMTSTDSMPARLGRGKERRHMGMGCTLPGMKR